MVKRKRASSKQQSAVPVEEANTKRDRPSESEVNVSDAQPCPEEWQSNCSPHKCAMPSEAQPTSARDAGSIFREPGTTPGLALEDSEGSSNSNSDTMSIAASSSSELSASSQTELMQQTASRTPRQQRQANSPRSPRRHSRTRRKKGILGLSYEQLTFIFGATSIVLFAVLLACSQDPEFRLKLQSHLPQHVAGYIDGLPRLTGLTLPHLADIKLSQLLSSGMPAFPVLGENLSMLSVGFSNISFSLGSKLQLAPQSMLALVQPFQFPRPGLDLKKQGLKPKHPVLIIPGFVTSGLELWETLPCASQQKRERVWGSWAMTSSFLLSKECWLKHLRLDEATGLDPEGVKVRASQGLEAVDYFLPGYHVWARLIEAFADFGYDNNILVAESYDWRLSAPNLEKRDGYFTRLKARIETMVQIHREKVMVVSHSWGDPVFRIFMAWLSASNPTWVERHIAIYTNLAGPTLGVPKALSSLLSGETRDTAELGYVVSMLINAHFTRAQRTALFRTWGGGIGLLPVGGPAVWGNASWAPDDPPSLAQAGKSYGAMVTLWEPSDENVEAAEKTGSKLTDTFSFKSSKTATKIGIDCAVNGNFSGPPRSRCIKFPIPKKISHLDVNSSLAVLLNDSDPNFREKARIWGSVGAEPQRCKANGEGDDFYFNPLDCPLPEAKNLQMFCIYGIGHDTERAYQYEHFRSQKAFDAAKKGASRDEDPTELDVRFKLNSDANDPGTMLDDGIRLSNGDGTVPLLSLGSLCRKHWQEPRLNPANFSVKTREYRHEPLIGTYSPLNPIHRYQQLTSFSRGGPRSADHMDVLSHEDILRDLLLMGAGQASKLQDQIISNIDEIAAKLPQ